MIDFQPIDVGRPGESSAEIIAGLDLIILDRSDGRWLNASSITMTVGIRNAEL